MIVLEVEDYCDEGCLAFKPDVTEPTKTYSWNGEVTSCTDTIIRCERRNICRQLKRYLEKRVKTDE